MNDSEDAIKWRDFSNAIEFFAFWILMRTDLIITLIVFICISVNISIVWFKWHGPTLYMALRYIGSRHYSYKLILSSLYSLYSIRCIYQLFGFEQSFDSYKYSLKRTTWLLLLFSSQIYLKRLIVSYRLSYFCQVLITHKKYR